MAASDRFYVHVKGKSTHAAQPHNGTDALVAAAHFIIDVQTLISREMNPMENVVCTIGLMNAGTRYNVGVEDAYLEGTVRTYTPALRDKMEQRLGELLKGLDYTFGTHSELNYVRGHSATINTPERLTSSMKLPRPTSARNTSPIRNSRPCVQKTSPTTLKNSPAPSSGSAPARKELLPCTMQASL